MAHLNSLRYQFMRIFNGSRQTGTQSVDAPEDLCGPNELRTLSPQIPKIQFQGGFLPKGVKN